jgi:hypothetical protein
MPYFESTICCYMIIHLLMMVIYFHALQRFVFLCYVPSFYSRDHISWEVITVYYSCKFKHARYSVFCYSHVIGTRNHNCSMKGIILLIRLTIKYTYITKISTSTVEQMSISFKQYKRKMTFFILSVLQDLAQQH